MDYEDSKSQRCRRIGDVRTMRRIEVAHFFLVIVVVINQSINFRLFMAEITYPHLCLQI